MNTSPWAPYRPSPLEPWNLERAWTLRRRAGFAATWAELQRDVAGNPHDAVDRVLAGQCRTVGVPADFFPTADLLGGSACGSSDARRLEAWWLYRMLFTPDPLTERLTLMWHDHFATSLLKVDDVAAMHAQNESLRKLGTGAVPRPGACHACRPGAADLARRSVESKRPAEREPGAGIDGVVHAWASAVTPRPTSRRRPGR